MAGASLPPEICWVEGNEFPEVSDLAAIYVRYSASVTLVLEKCKWGNTRVQKVGQHTFLDLFKRMYRTYGCFA